MPPPHAARLPFPRRMLLLMAGAGVALALADRNFGARGQTPDPTGTSGAVPGTPAASPEGATPATPGTPIRVIVGENVLTARLWDNVTARDLIDLLPLTLPFRDYNNVEKIADLPRPLSTEGLPAGDDPIPADIGYYAPSNDLVLYYGDVGYFPGIVRIGHFDSNVDVIANQPDDVPVRIELAD